MAAWLSPYHGQVVGVSMLPAGAQAPEREKERREGQGRGSGKVYFLWNLGSFSHEVSSLSQEEKTFISFSHTVVSIMLV